MGQRITQASDPSPVLFHQRSAAFINQLVAVGDPTKRIALLSRWAVAMCIDYTLHAWETCRSFTESHHSQSFPRAFCEDWEGAAPRQKPQSQAHKGQPDFVRPGRFLTTLHSMMTQMEVSVSATVSMNESYHLVPL